MMDHCQADATVTYFLISAVGENICSGNTSHFIPIQWHSKLSILDTEQIYFNILPPLRPREGDDTLLSSVQGNQIKIHTLVDKPKLSKFQTVQYLYYIYQYLCPVLTKDMATFALQALKT